MDVIEQMQMQREHVSPAQTIGQTSYVRIAGEMIVIYNEAGGE